MTDEERDGRREELRQAGLLVTEREAALIYRRRPVGRDRENGTCNCRQDPLGHGGMAATGGPLPVVEKPRIRFDVLPRVKKPMQSPTITRRELIEARVLPWGWWWTPTPVTDAASARVAARNRTRQELDRFLSAWPQLVGTDAEARVLRALADAPHGGRSRLPEKLADLLTLRFRDGVTDVRAIGKRIGVGKSTVSNWLRMVAQRSPDEGSTRADPLAEVARLLGDFTLPDTIPAHRLSDEDRLFAAELLGYTDERGREIALPPVPSRWERRWRRQLRKTARKSFMARFRDREAQRAREGLVERTVRQCAERYGHGIDDTEDIMQDVRVAVVRRFAALRHKSPAYLRTAVENAVTSEVRKRYMRERKIDEVRYAPEWIAEDVDENRVFTNGGPGPAIEDESEIYARIAEDGMSGGSATVTANLQSSERPVRDA